MNMLVTKSTKWLHKMKEPMIKTLPRTMSVAFLGLLIVAPCASAQESPTPGFNTRIPESVLTPDEVETRVGTLEFFDGIPTKETAEALFENLDMS
ncbi:MAG: hypothetical protein KAR22_16385, partial [Gammaproteobacteria bacterium]|nr:hypothetical protein [Gammaproteobacteria bacterium]